MSVTERRDAGSRPVRGDSRPGPAGHVPWVAAAWLLAGVGVLVIALVVGGGRPKPAAPGLPDPGMLTGWGLPIAKLAMDLAAVGAVGSLLFGVLAPTRAGALEPAATRALRGAATCAWAWAAAAALTLMFTLSDFLGIPVTRLDYRDNLAGFVAEVTQGRSLAVVFLLAVILAATARGVRTLNGVALLLVLAVTATLPPALTGHSASAADHDIATSSLLVHIVAVTLWVGGLAGLAVYGRRATTPALGSAAGRYSALALWCFAAAGFSGLVNAWVRLGGIAPLFTSSYGWLVLGKLAALVALGWFGWWHRRRTLPALGRKTPGGFRRFAAVEATVMAATIGLAVALSRTPTPVPEEAERQSTAQALIGWAVPPFSWSHVLTLWRPDTLVLVAAATGVVLYLRGVWRLRTRDLRWPVGRTVSWLFGVAVTVFVLCSGVATYAPAMFSVHMAQHMTLTMLSPILLAMGAPVTLALRALPAGRRGGREQNQGRGMREWILTVLHSRVARVITHPLVALALYVLSLYAFYFTGLFAAAMSNHTGHLLMTFHFLAVGSLYFWPIIGLDPMPRRLPPFGRMLLLFASMPFHAFFGVIVMTTTTVLGAEWFAGLRLPWLDPLADQNVGGGIAWAAAELPVLIVLGVVFAQWVRADAREAKRLDRRADAGDDRLSDYNAMLARLAARDDSGR
ncbi:putative copper resistance protein D [Actinopolymorpha singaporensis]|uniref:Putative copper resistance protein D n=1 Tax=Actinopolymorpha singaporensis TaxID=117157 RepID=A0A1H1VAN7_9ACTN|nr:putative copper resistance protein D [Actinopolymorpha singaporensis]